MTREETKKLMNEISTLYPRFVSSNEDRKMKVDLWSEVLEKYTYEEIHRGLIYYASKNPIFPPSPGQLIDEGHDELSDLDFLV